MDSNKEYMVQKIKNWLAVESKINELSRQLKMIQILSMANIDQILLKNSLIIDTKPIIF